eukprot:m.65741 g.65741  ORF g.65741 m.65741 type:complete len:347 (-) comp12621_c0_seq1:125-1165(-)
MWAVRSATRVSKLLQSPVIRQRISLLRFQSTFVRRFSTNEPALAATQEAPSPTSSIISEPGDEFMKLGLAAFKEGKGEASAKRALAFFRQAMDAGSMAGAFNVASFLLHGIGGEKNAAEAARLFTELAAKGHLESMYHVACIRIARRGADPVPDARTLLERCAENGLKEAHQALGAGHADGSFGPPDFAAARACLERGIAAGDPKCSVLLARMHTRGEGGPVDHDAAFKCNLDASKKGSVMAYYNLGVHYLEGKGVGQSYARAADYFRFAADRGFLYAQVNLAQLFIAGKGVERDLATAAALLDAAAASDPALAQRAAELRLQLAKEQEERQKGVLGRVGSLFRTK